MSYSVASLGGRRPNPLTWAPNTLAALVVDAQVDGRDVEVIPSREIEVAIAPRYGNEDGVNTYGIIHGLVAEADVILGHGFLKSDQWALHMVDPTSSRRLASHTVDTLELLRDRVALAMPHKRIPYGGLGLSQLTRHLDVPVPAKVHDPDPVNDCIRLMHLWVDLLQSESLLYEHLGNWSNKRDLGVIPVDDDLRSALIEDPERAAPPQHPLSKNMSIPAEVGHLSGYALRQSLQFMGPVANMRARGTLVDGGRLNREDTTALLRAERLARHPEVLWTRGNKSLGRAPVTVQLAVRNAMRDWEGGSATAGESIAVLERHHKFLEVHPIVRGFRDESAGLHR